MEKIISALRNLGCYGPGFAFDLSERVLITADLRRGASASATAEKIIQLRRNAKHGHKLSSR